MLKYVEPPRGYGNLAVRARAAPSTLGDGRRLYLGAVAADDGGGGTGDDDLLAFGLAPAQPAAVGPAPSSRLTGGDDGGGLLQSLEEEGEEEDDSTTGPPLIAARAHRPAVQQSLSYVTVGEGAAAPLPARRPRLPAPRVHRPQLLQRASPRAAPAPGLAGDHHGEADAATGPPAPPPPSAAASSAASSAAAFPRVPSLALGSVSLASNLSRGGFDSPGGASSVREVYGGSEARFGASPHDGAAAVVAPSPPRDEWFSSREYQKLVTARSVVAAQKPLSARAALGGGGGSSGGGDARSSHLALPVCMPSLTRLMRGAEVPLAALRDVTRAVPTETVPVSVRAPVVRRRRRRRRGGRGGGGGAAAGPEAGGAEEGDASTEALAAAAAAARRQAPSPPAGADAAAAGCALPAVASAAPAAATGPLGAVDAGPGELPSHSLAAAAPRAPWRRRAAEQSLENAWFSPVRRGGPAVPRELLPASALGAVRA